MREQALPSLKVTSSSPPASPPITQPFSSTGSLAFIRLRPSLLLLYIHISFIINIDNLIPGPSLPSLSISVLHRSLCFPWALAHQGQCHSLQWGLCVCPLINKSPAPSVFPSTSLSSQDVGPMTQQRFPLRQAPCSLSLKPCGWRARHKLDKQWAQLKPPSSPVSPRPGCLLLGWFLRSLERQFLPADLGYLSSGGALERIRFSGECERSSLSAHEWSTLPSPQWAASILTAPRSLAGPGGCILLPWLCGHFSLHKECSLPPFCSWTANHCPHPFLWERC